jgi:hypothetical protein
LNSLRNIVKAISKYLPWSIQDRIIFILKLGYFPKIKNAATFNEKVLFRKQHRMLDIKYSCLSDKFLVRGYVSRLIGDSYFVPLMFYTESPEALSNYCPSCDIIIKPNHGAGMYRIVRASRYDAEVNEIIALCNKWLLTDFSHVQREIHYRNIPRKILVEKLLGDGRIAPTDYKFHMFRNGEGEFNFVLQIINERFSGRLARTFYVNNFDAPFDTGSRATADSTPDDLHKVDKRLALEALGLSRLLAADFDYVRVDWYVHGGAIYFSELTFTPAAGFGVGYGMRLDKLMGEFWV